MNRPEPHRPPSDSPGLLYGLLAFCSLLILHWVAVNLAAFVSGHGWPVALNDSGVGLAKLYRHPGEPRLAFPASIQEDLAGPKTYWASVVLVLLVVVALASVIGSKITHTRTEAVNRRRRLGVPTEPSLATAADLAPLIVRRPEHDRLLLVRYRKGWLATEAASTPKRRGTQGGVAVIGASQSGKTTALIESVTHWSGPAVVCSVKTDLMRLTINPARGRGDVKVFDPLGISRIPTCRWSPLRSAQRLEGATSAASLLMHSAGDGSANDRFWRGQAEQLLAGMMWAAANLDGHTMVNVVSWVLNLDMPGEDGQGTLAPLVRMLRDHQDPQVAAEAAEVDGWLHGQWKTDPRTTSSVYATARDATWPWANPRIRASAIDCDIDLDWLTSGPNTLYLCAPLGDHKLGLVFSAVIQDIVEQVFQRSNADGPVKPRLLLCVDETANTPMPKMAEWASTLTGTGTQLVTVWQSRAQLDEIYGRHADTVLTNHRTKLIFPSGLSDGSTAEYISHLVGDEHVRGEIEEQRLFATSGARRSPYDRIPASQTRFLPPHVLRTARPGDALVIHGHLPPAWIRAHGQRR